MLTNIFSTKYTTIASLYLSSKPFSTLIISYYKVLNTISFEDTSTLSGSFNDKRINFSIPLSKVAENKSVYLLSF